MSPIWPYRGARVVSVYRLAAGDDLWHATGIVTCTLPASREVEVLFRGLRWPRVTYAHWLVPADGLRVVRARRGRR